MASDPLLQPLTVNQLTLKNRIYSSGHAPAGYLDSTGRPGERYALYHEEKAKGGLGLTIIGGSSNVAIDSADVFSQIDAGHDTVLPFYRDVTTRVHSHGSAIMIQITHMGRRSQWDIDNWMPTVGPSSVRERQHRSFPKSVEKFDIERIVTAYGQAAQRARLGGFDGIEIMASAGHLIDEFWSPRTNTRDDEFGGPLESRMRFGFLVLDEVRRRVGPDFAVGMRIPGDEGSRTGMDAALCVEIAAALSSSGLLDFLSVVYGGGHTERELAGLMPTFGTPLGGRLDMAGAIRDKVTVPVFHAGRITDVATARHALTAGMADLVGMTRAHIADPHIVKKLISGDEDRIRPCVGATYCVSRAETFCIHNPATGREKFIPHLTPPGRTVKRVVVVGGGPAGLESARVCSERGHQVILLEAGSSTGGQVQLASRTDRASEKLGIVAWLKSEALLAGAQIRLNTYAEAADIRALSPDVVIVATGGYPNTDIIESGAELLSTTWDVMSNRPRPERSVLIYDDHGGEQSLTAAERLVSAGVRVELVTPDRLVGHDVQGVLAPDYLTALYAGGAVLTPDQELSSVTRESGQLKVSLTNVFTDEQSYRLVDDVVVEHGTLPVDDLYFELTHESTNSGETDLEALVAGRPQQVTSNANGSFELFRIGDAVTHRNIHAAIYEARRLCLQL